MQRFILCNKSAVFGILSILFLEKKIYFTTVYCFFALCRYDEAVVKKHRLKDELHTSQERLRSALNTLEK